MTNYNQGGGYKMNAKAVVFKCSPTQIKEFAISTATPISYQDGICLTDFSEFVAAVAGKN